MRTITSPTATPAACRTIPKDFRDDELVIAAMYDEAWRCEWVAGDRRQEERRARRVEEHRVCVVDCVNHRSHHVPRHQLVRRGAGRDARGKRVDRAISRILAERFPPGIEDALRIARVQACRRQCREHLHDKFAPYGIGRRRRRRFLGWADDALHATHRSRHTERIALALHDFAAKRRGRGALNDDDRSSRERAAPERTYARLELVSDDDLVRAVAVEIADTRHVADCRAA
jgi:hypothetical protein